MQPTKIKQFITICMLLILSTNTQGQDFPDSLEYKINLRVSGSRMSGVFNRSSLAFSADKDFHKGKWTFHNTLSYRRSQFNGLQIEDNWYDLFSVFYYPNERKLWYPIAFYHFDNNLLFRVNRRHRYGAGLASNLVKTDKVFLQLSTTLGYEDTHYNGDVFINSDLDNAIRQNGLFMVYLNNDYTLLDKRFKLKLNVFYMQSLKESADYDIWFRPSLQYMINKHIALNVNYDYRLENVYLEDLTAANDILLFGINVNFANK